MNERNSAGPTGAVAGAISLTGDASLVQRFGQWLSRRRWRLGSIVGGLLFWELCARYFANPLFLAAPSHIAVAVVKLWESRLPNDIALSASVAGLVRHDLRDFIAALAVPAGLGSSTPQ
jgi:ABC-type nitrate/sulfonate/bicarbonate transport system permease component